MVLLKGIEPLTSPLPRGGAGTMALFLLRRAIGHSPNVPGWFPRFLSDQRGLRGGSTP